MTDQAFQQHSKTIQRASLRDGYVTQVSLIDSMLTLPLELLEIKISLYANVVRKIIQVLSHQSDHVEGESLLDRHQGGQFSEAGRKKVVLVVSLSPWIQPCLNSSRLNVIGLRRFPSLLKSI